MYSPFRPLVSQAPQRTREAMLHYQQRSLQKLLQYVWKHSAFYRDYYASHGIREQDLSQLTVGDLPLLAKQTLMEHFDAAVTDPRLRKQELAQWIQESRDPRQLYRNDFIVLNSSGSSGDIAIFVYHRRAWQLMSAMVAPFLPPPENALHGKTRVASYLASHGHFGGVTTSVLLPKSVFDVCVLSLLDPTEDVVEQLHAFQPHRLSGYASSISSLAELALQGTLDIHPQTIIVSGDLLTPSMEQKIQQAWQAPIYDMYATAESIFVAVKGPRQEEMVVVDELNIVEVLGDVRQPVAAGEVGQVVITNLYNNTLPILRYELADYVVAAQRPDSPRSLIRDIKGRANDVLPVMLHDGRSDTISPHILESFYVPGLEKIQYISQRPDHLHIHYVAGQNIDDGVRQEFQHILDMKGALRTTFTVQRVQQIDLDPQTGKLRVVKIEKYQGNAADRVADIRMAQSPTASSASREGSPAVQRFSGSITGDRQQQSIRARCFHPSGHFRAFHKEEIEQSIAARFEQQVEQYPERTAVHSRNTALTYEELNRAANRLGHAIVALRGMGAEPVALLLQQGAQAIAATLGVLKVGKSYVPLDPTYPHARLMSILEDSQAGLILTDNRNIALAAELAQGRGVVLNIDELDASLSADNPGFSIPPDAVASIFYTSGSTGEPKGVIQTQRSILHRVMVDTNTFHLCPEDRLSLLSSPSYSVSLRNLFGALLNGAAVHPFDIDAEGLAPLADWLIQEGITIYFSVPTVFRHFLEGIIERQQFSRLRLIYLAGEPATRRDVDLYQTNFSHNCIFVNSLASNEAGIMRQYFIDHEGQSTGNILPTGYEVDDKQILILDDDDREVDAHQVGEIAVRSRYLSPGYWHRTDLTSAAFRPDPAGGDERLYRTGDLGYLLPDGCLVYLGRKGPRVKVRGARVELEEVEAVLGLHPAVREAVLETRTDDTEDSRLIAYIVSQQDQAPTTSELRHFLQTRLPEYMIPSVFVFLEALPLSPNGKIDRTALPDPGVHRPELDAPFVAPRTPVEAELAKIWAEVLSLERVGVHDDFWELGGHSLAAMRVIARVSDRFLINLPMQALFEAPTVAGMGRELVHYQIQHRQGDELSHLAAEMEELSKDDPQKGNRP